MASGASNTTDSRGSFSSRRSSGQSQSVKAQKAVKKRNQLNLQKLHSEGNQIINEANNYPSEYSFFLYNMWCEVNSVFAGIISQLYFNYSF
jgi:hypothetical protein